MCLQEQVRLHQAAIIQEDIIHRDSVSAKMIRAVNDPNLREISCQAFFYHGAVGVHRDLIDLRANQQGLDDIAIQWLTGQQAVILLWYAYRLVTHRNKRCDLDHDRFTCIIRSEDPECQRSFGSFLPAMGIQATHDGLPATG